MLTGNHPKQRSPITPRIVARGVSGLDCVSGLMHHLNQTQQWQDRRLLKLLPEELTQSESCPQKEDHHVQQDRDGIGDPHDPPSGDEEGGVCRPGYSHPHGPSRLCLEGLRMGEKLRVILGEKLEVMAV